MDMKQYLADLTTWANNKSIELEVIVDNKMDKRNVRLVDSLHKDLGCLYGSFNSIIATWESGDGKCGGLHLMSPSEMIERFNKNTNNGYSDNEVLSSGFDRKWWKINLSVFRRLIKFHDEGSGDGLYIDRSTGVVYFLAHDWMDWISKEPPMIMVGGSIDEVYGKWAMIGFARPKNLYWMKALKNGRFSGFNENGFMVI